MILETIPPPTDVAADPVIPATAASTIMGPTTGHVGVSSTPPIPNKTLPTYPSAPASTTLLQVFSLSNLSFIFYLSSSSLSFNLMFSSSFFFLSSSSSFLET